MSDTTADTLAESLISDFLERHFDAVEAIPAWRRMLSRELAAALVPVVAAQVEAARADERERILNVLWETGCSHPWVSEDGKTKRWLGGWCYKCYDDIIHPLEVALGHDERTARNKGEAT